jgi:hypothetical protein
MAHAKVALNGDELTPEINAQILEKLEEIRQLMPFAVGLSARDRLTLPALGSKSTQFVQRSLESMRQNPTLVPAFVELSSVESSYAMYNSLLGIVESIQQLERLAMDTMHSAGNYSLSQSLEFYNSVKRGARANVPGAQSVLESLKTRFKIVRRSGGNATDAGGGEQAVA